MRPSTSSVTRRIGVVLLCQLAASSLPRAQAQQPQDTTYAPSACRTISLPPHADSIDAQVVSRMRLERIPAVQIAVLKNGRIEARAYGYADLQHCSLADTNTVFGLGSVSKQLTAYAVLRAVEAGRLGLDDAITKYLPEAKPAWDRITVRHLLTHTSGIRDYAGDDPVHPQTRIDSRAEYSADSLIKVFAAPPLNFQPGTEMAYSNTGYKMLSILLERALDKPFPELMRALVFEPLHMRSTVLWDPGTVVPHLAYGYRISDGTLMRGRYTSRSVAHYGGDFFLMSTANDMARFAAELIRPAHVSVALLAQMTARARLADGSTVQYGFGIRPNDVRGVPALDHGGTWSGGYTAFDEILPTRGEAIVVLNNNWDAQPWALAPGVLLSVDDSLRAMPDTAADADSARTKRLQAFLTGDSTAIAVTPSFARHQYAFLRAVMGEMAPHLRRLWFRGCDDLRRSKAALPAGVVAECYYRMDMDDGGGMTLGVYFTPTGAIAEIRPK